MHTQRHTHEPAEEEEVARNRFNRPIETPGTIFMGIIHWNCFCVREHDDLLLSTVPFLACTRFFAPQKPWIQRTQYTHRFQRTSVGWRNFYECDRAACVYLALIFYWYHMFYDSNLSKWCSFNTYTCLACGVCLLAPIGHDFFLDSLPLTSSCANKLSYTQ